jgi:hypothetical protein
MPPGDNTITVNNNNNNNNNNYNNDHHHHHAVKDLALIPCSSLNTAKPEVALMGVLSSFFIMACDSPNIS